MHTDLSFITNEQSQSLKDRFQVEEQAQSLPGLTFFCLTGGIQLGDLAELYGVETKVLKQAVRRNITRFFG